MPPSPTATFEAILSQCSRVDDAEHGQNFLALYLMAYLYWAATYAIDCSKKQGRVVRLEMKMGGEFEMYYGGRTVRVRHPLSPPFGALWVDYAPAGHRETVEPKSSDAEEVKLQATSVIGEALKYLVQVQ